MSLGFYFRSAPGKEEEEEEKKKTKETKKKNVAFRTQFLRILFSEPPDSTR